MLKQFYNKFNETFIRLQRPYVLYNKFCALANEVFVRLEVHSFVKLIVIIADFHCMLFLAAATHSLVTELARKCNL